MAPRNAEPAMEPADDPSWALYPETILELRLGDRTLRVDLRERLPPGLPRQLAKVGPQKAFAVVTSDNPCGRHREGAENRRDGAELARELQARGAFHVPADGVSPDGSHREQGYAIWCGVEAARRLARTHGQSAFFWFDGSGFRIEGALVEARPQRLPLGVT
jgi:hypothetical protein